MHLSTFVILFTFSKVAYSCSIYIQIGTTYSDTYRNADVIVAYDKMGLKMCGRRCIYQDQCEGINYNPTTLTCELLKSGGTLEISVGCLHSPINTWTMDSDSCHANPCDNSRKCVKTKSNGHVCVTVAPPCDKVVCQNGGTCKNGVTSFTCLCMVGYIGINCEICSFDSGWCAGWQKVNTGQMDWIHNSGLTPSSLTGPSSDVTLGTPSGWYVYTEVTGSLEGNKARFTSGVLTPSTSLCLQFYYHMYGSTMGTLRVLKKTTTGETILWSLTGNQGDIWFSKRITITGSSFEIVFEGIRGSDFYSDMAVDDIILINGAC